MEKLFKYPFFSLCYENHRRPRTHIFRTRRKQIPRQKRRNFLFVECITADTKAITPGEQEILCEQRERDTRIFPVCSVHPDHTSASALRDMEELLREKKIFGLKIFPGYHSVFPSDKKYHCFYELAGTYGVPVVIHTGDTFGSDYFVKYAHPLDVDEVAVRFRKTNFVLAHLGNPWVRDAAEVVYKNENVYADISAFCLGMHMTDVKRIVQDVRFALNYTQRPDKFLYGSDWPLVDMGQYIRLMQKAVPEKYHEQVFFENANTLFNLQIPVR